MTNDDLISSKILIVDDQLANVRLLERLLETEGYRSLSTTTDPREVLERYRSFRPDLILLDLVMPHLDGVAVVEQLKQEIPAGAFVPIVILTAEVTPEAKRRALAAGAHDFLTKPFEALEVVLRIRNLLNTRRLYLALEAQNRSLDQTVKGRTERLLQSEKVATMGSLIAGVAHELNNPLAVVLGEAMLLRETAAGSAFAGRAEKIYTAAQRSARIVKNFLALARNRPPERGPVALNSVVTEAVELLAYELRTSAVQVDLRLSESVPVFQADAHQLHQVVVNLLANAHHAIRETSGPRRITLASEFDAAAGRVRLTITDTGPGIPWDIQARIFEPFFTTKPSGEGTGLGLSLCRGIVEDHGGSLTVESQPGQGATFIVTLPATTGAAITAINASTRATPVSPKNILVVDDEPDIAAILVETLQHDGHKVDAAADGAEALAQMERRNYEVIFTDTKMPRMDGTGFYHELVRRFPGLARRVVFVTGDVMDREKRDWLESTGCLSLTKPFDINDVRRAVHRVFGTAE